jgi:hypothetical protein
VSCFARASDTVNAYIFTSAQYNDFQEEGVYTQLYEKKVDEVTSGTLGYYIPAKGTYYFILVNIHSGFLGFSARAAGRTVCFRFYSHARARA